MDLKLLEKLVRLANNNSNEHEANLATRRACKLIEEGKFQFTSIPPMVNDTSVRTWNDVRRSTESEFRSKPPTSSYGHNYYWEILEKLEKERVKNTARAQSERRVDYADYNNSNHPMYVFNERKKKEKRILKCKICGELKETLFVGLAELFECNECQWTTFNKREKK